MSEAGRKRPSSGQDARIPDLRQGILLKNVRRNDRLKDPVRSLAIAWSARRDGRVRARRRPSALLCDTQELLALVATFEQPPQRRRRILQAVLHVDLVLQLSRLHPAGERADRLGSARHVIEHDEAFHPSALDDEVEVVLRSRRRLGRVVVRDPAAKHNPPAHRETSQRRVEDVAADVVEENVDPFGAQLLQPRLNVLRLVVDRRIEAGFVGQPAAFLLPARDADDAAPLDLGDLPGHRARRAGRAGYDDCLARDGRPTSIRPK